MCAPAEATLFDLRTERPSSLSADLMNEVEGEPSLLFFVAAAADARYWETANAAASSSSTSKTALIGAYDCIIHH